MRQIGQTSNKNRHTQVYLNAAYDVVAQNGIIIGSVRYAFVNGDGIWCIAITGHNGMPYHGTSLHETGSLFDLKEGEPTWTMPVAQPTPGFRPELSEDFLAMDALMSEPALSLPLLYQEGEPAMKK